MCNQHGALSGEIMTIQKAVFRVISIWSKHQTRQNYTQGYYYHN